MTTLKRVMAFLEEMRLEGVHLSVEGGDLLARGPVSEQVAVRIRENKDDLVSVLSLMENTQTRSASLIMPDPSGVYDPFPLNETQQAYWLGRDAVFESGEVAIHVFIEMEDGNLDLVRAEAAWRKVYWHHEMLRAIVLPDGRQQILENPPEWTLPVEDLSSLGDEDCQRRVQALRDEMSHYCADLNLWPSWRLIGFKLPDGRRNLMLSLDCWAIDGRSIQILASDFETLYRDPDAVLPQTDLTFRDYVLGLEEEQKTAGYQRSLSYWQQRVKHLPAAPRLPRAEKAVDHSPRFVRHKRTLPASVHQRLKHEASARGLTLANVLIACFAQVLGRWSGERHFTLNIPRWNRHALHDDVDQIAGEFATFELLEVDLGWAVDFQGFAARLQRQFAEDLNHDIVSGVRILREWRKHTGADPGVAMPFVFTHEPDNFSDEGRDRAYMASFNQIAPVKHALTQTPQVWIDAQYHDVEGNLLLVWDALDDLFPSGLIDDMFEAYADMAEQLGGRADAWEQQETLISLPETQQQTRTEINDTQRNFKLPLFREALARNADKAPTALAVADARGDIDWSGLKQRVDCLSIDLQKQGIAHQDVVAVAMPKGAEQVIAALALHQIGAVCVPLDPDTPADRFVYMVSHCEAKAVLTVASMEGPLANKLSDLAALLRQVDRDAVASAEEAPSLSPLQPDDLHCILYTSGSTGLPKGVMVPLDALMNVVADGEDRYDLSADSRWLCLTPFHHDLSLFDLYGAVAFGGAVILPDADQRRDPAHWLDLIDRYGVSGWNSVPAMMTMFLDYCDGRNLNRQARQQKVESLRQVILGGDWVPVETPRRLAQLAPNASLTTIGGPTETTIWNISYPAIALPEGWRSIPYGRPTSNNRYYVLNENLEDCPDWVPGELCCTGAGVTAGYLADPDRTALTYVTHPQTGEPMFRTGDRGRFHPDGLIEFLGRDDNQINLNGYRLELGELETALARHPAVDQAVAVPQRDGNIVRNIIVWARLLPGETVAASVLEAFLKGAVPAQMQPKAVRVIDRFPLTVNGKVDRRRLEEEAAADVQDKAAFIAENPLQEEVAAVWQDVLGELPADAEASFFDLGGDSLTAIQLFNRLLSGRVEGATVLSIFRAPSIKAQAELLGGSGAAGVDLPPVVPTELDDVSYPATAAQARLWFEDRLTENGALYNLCFNLRLDGQIDPQAIEGVITQIVDRWENFRIALKEGEDGAPVQVLIPAWRVTLDQSDIKQAELQDEALASLGRAEAERPFDLASGRLLRAHLVWLSARSAALIVTMHHAVSDGATFDLFVKALADGLRGLEIAVPELSSIDYARWEELPHVGQEVDRQIDWWRERVDIAVPAADLGTAGSRPVIRSAPGHLHSRAFSTALSEHVADLARRCETTPYVVLMTALAAALRHWSRDDVVRIGTHVGLRTTAGLEETPGMLVNNIVLDFAFDREHGFDKAVAAARTHFMEGWGHALAPFNRVVQALGGWPDTSRHPLYNITFTHENMSAAAIEIDDLLVKVDTPFVAMAPLDLDLAMTDLPDGRIGLRGVYNSAVVDKNTIDKLYEAMEVLLETVSVDPSVPIGSIPVSRMSDSELLSLGSGPAIVHSAHNPVEIFEHLVQSQPNAPALLDERGGVLMDFAGLDHRVRQALGSYKIHGVGAGETIAIQLGRGSDLVAAMLAAWRSGCHFVALSKDQPRERACAIIADSGARLLVTDVDSSNPDMPVSQPDSWKEASEIEPVEMDVLAALVYTSGSTGVPNGVEFTRTALMNRLSWQWRAFPFDKGECCVARTSVDFVDYLAELFGPILAGRPVSILPDDAVKDPKRLADAVHAVQARRLLVVPSLLNLLLDDTGNGALVDRMSSVSLWVSSGEPLKPATADALLGRCSDIRLVNLYGSSETGADATMEELRPDIPFGIGRAIDNLQVHVVDPSLSPLPPGLPGQLLVTGAGLARGYRNRPDLTAQRFISWRGMKAFLTGDYAVREEGGGLRLLGRLDRQVKVRGQRIELDEVQAVLQGLPSVGQAAVALSGEGAIVAAVVLEQDSDMSTIRKRLAEVLTEAALPSRLVVLEALPRTAGGKIAYARLARLIEEKVAEVGCTADVPPATEVEKQLAALWQEVLSVAPQSKHDRFFDLGGHSIAVARLAARIRRDYALDLPLRAIIHRNSLEDMALLLEEQLGQCGSSEPDDEDSEIFVFDAAGD